ncbi:MAG TPA: hypothetical protein VGH40_03695 [Roseiarcus sp.]
MPFLAVAEDAPQSADLNLQIRFLDERLRPGSGYQLLLADHFASMFEQNREDIERAAAEPYRLIALEQKPLRRKEPKRPKRDRITVHKEARRVPLFLPHFT